MRVSLLFSFLTTATFNTVSEFESWKIICEAFYLNILYCLESLQAGCAAYVNLYYSS